MDGQTDEVFLDHLHAATFQYTPLGRTILGPAHNVKINKVLTPMSRRMTRNKCDRWFGDRGSHFCHHLDHLITHTRFLINILKTYKVVVIVCIYICIYFIPFKWDPIFTCVPKRCYTTNTCTEVKA